LSDTELKTKTKLSQNIQALIGEIGEKQVLLRLSILVHQTKWEVFHNLGEAGYDILLMNAVTGERIRIEVKARQRLYTTGKARRRVNFFLTNGEYQACDFLIAYFVDSNGFYIIPREELKRATVRDQIRWRYTLAFSHLSQTDQGKGDFFNAWETLHPDFERKILEENQH
jgi:hypothetical protein